MEKKLIVIKDVLKDESLFWSVYESIGAFHGKCIKHYCTKTDDEFMAEIKKDFCEYSVEIRVIGE